MLMRFATCPTPDSFAGAGLGIADRRARVEERLGLNEGKVHITSPVRLFERFKHRIPFAGDGVIDRRPVGVTLFLI